MIKRTLCFQRAAISSDFLLIFTFLQHAKIIHKTHVRLHLNFQILMKHTTDFGLKGN